MLRGRKTERVRFEDGSCFVSCQCCFSTGQVETAKCPNQSRLDLFAEGNWEVFWRDVVRVAAPVHTHNKDAEVFGSMSEHVDG